MHEEIDHYVKMTSNITKQITIKGYFNVTSFDYGYISTINFAISDSLNIIQLIGKDPGYAQQEKTTRAVGSRKCQKPSSWM